MVSPTRDRIVVATTELFRRHGFNGTSLKQISDAAEATTGSIYHFFPDGKDQLAREVVEVAGEAYRQLFVMITSDAPDPVTAVGDFFEGAAAVLEGTDFIDPCPIGTVAREVASVNDPLRRATDRVIRSWVGAATDLFERAGIAAGEAQDLAVTLVAAIEGGFVVSRAARDAAPMRAIGTCARALVATAVASARAPTR